MERSSVRKEPSWSAYASNGSSCTEQVVMNPRRPRFTPARGTWCAAAREETVSMVPSPPKVTSMLHRTMACSRASGVSMTQDPSPWRESSRRMMRSASPSPGFSANATRPITLEGFMRASILHFPAPLNW